MPAGENNLAQRLRTIGNDMAQAPWQDRREALRRCLEHEVGRLSRSEAAAALTALKSELQNSGGDGGETAELRSTVSGLESECERLRRDRERVRRELEEARQAASEAEGLRAENKRLTEALDRSPYASRSGTLRGFRDGMVKCLDGAKPDPGEMGFSGEDAALFRAMGEVLSFALNYDMGANHLILEISGKLDSDGTTMAVMTRKLFRKHFLKSLKGDEEAFQRLQGVLQQNVKFLLLMSLAYLNSYRPGVRGLLGELDPQSLLSKNRGIMGVGFDYKQAFNAFQASHTSLHNLTRDDLWERFFSRGVRKELSDYVDDLPE